MPIDTATVAVSHDAESKSRSGFASTQDAFDTVVTQINERVAFASGGSLTAPTITGGTVTNATIATPTITGGTITTATLTTPTITTPTVTGTLTGSDAIVAHSATAIPAAGAGIAGLKFSSTADFGVFFGAGAPVHSAAKGSMYMRSNGSGTNNRIYVNTDGGSTWTALLTVA